MERSTRVMFLCLPLCCLALVFTLLGTATCGSTAPPDANPGLSVHAMVQATAHLFTGSVEDENGIDVDSLADITQLGVPPRISGMTSALGYHAWRPVSDARLRYLGDRFGMVRVEFALVGEWLNPDARARARAISEARGIAQTPASRDSLLLMELKVDEHVNDLYAKYADFCRGMADALWKAGHRNVIIELSNEPNIAPYLDNAETYAILANTAATAIRSVSQFLICTGGISMPVLPNRTGPYQWSVDVIRRIDWSKVNFFGYHAYESSPERIGGFYLDECIAYMRNLLANYAPGKACDVLMTEMSWHSSDVPDPSTRAALYSRMALIHIRNSVESAVWFPFGSELPSAAFSTAWGLNWGFPGNPKKSSTVTGNAPFVGVNVTNLYCDTVGRKYDSIGAIHVALWRPILSSAGARLATISIPKGYICATYCRLDNPYNTVKPLTVSGSQISNVPISGLPILLFLRKTRYWADIYDGPYGYIDPTSNRPTCQYSMVARQTKTFQLKILNLGTATWTNRGAGTIYVRLTGVNAEKFRAADWLPWDSKGLSLPATIKGASVPPGGTTVLQWSMKAPQVTQTTTYPISVGIYGKGVYAGDVCDVKNIGSYSITVRPRP